MILQKDKTSPHEPVSLSLQSISAVPLGETFTPSRLFYSLSSKYVFQIHLPVMAESYQCFKIPTKCLLTAPTGSYQECCSLNSWHNQSLLPSRGFLGGCCCFKCIVFLESSICLFITDRVYGSCLITRMLHALQTLNEYLLTAKN